MKTSNKLFVICTIYVPVMLIALPYPQIHDYYTYSVPLNDFAIERWMYSQPDYLSSIQNKDDTTCFIAPSKHLFCYRKPRMSENSGASYITSDVGIDGELHFERIDNNDSYFTMKKIMRIHNDTAKITFADKGYGEISNKFEFTITVQKYDTFIAECSNLEGTSADLVQYLGVTIIDGVEYFVTWHTLVSSEKGIACDYPQIIKASLNHDFGV